MGQEGQGDVYVELGRRAEDDPLARELRRRVVANLQRRRFARSFRRMWGTVVIVATRGSGSTLVGDPSNLHDQVTLTLRFDWGRLMIHEGRVGRPDVTLWGPADSILALGEEPLQPRSHWGALRRVANSSRTLRPFWAFGRALRDRRLRIYGLGVHGRFVWRLVQLLAVDGVPADESPSIE